MTNRITILFFFSTLFFSTSKAQTQIGQDLYGVANAFYGYDIDLAKNGARLAIGINGQAYNGGQVRVFDLGNGTWTQVGIPIPALTRNDSWGYNDFAFCRR